MQQVSEKFLAILDGQHTVDRALQIGGSGPAEPCVEIPGTVYYNSSVVSIDSKSAVLGREAPGIGNCISNKMTAAILRPDGGVRNNDRVVPYVRVRSRDDVSEWIPKGVYFVDTSKKRRSAYNDITADITAYDVLMLAEADYVPRVGMPSDAVTVARDIAGQLGTELDPETEASLIPYAIPDPEGKYSQKEMLGYIAAMHGGNMISDDFGRLKLIRLAAIMETPAVILRSQGNRLRVGDELAGITGVELHHGDGIKDVSGNADGTMLSAELAWANGDMAARILNQAAGYAYIPDEVKKTVISPLVELGDVAMMPDGKMEYIYELNVSFLAKLVASVGAPEVKALNHEAKFQTKAERQTARALKGIGASITDIKHGYNAVIANVDEVTAGLYAVATKSLIDAAREAKTTVFAQIDDSLSKTVKKAELSLFAISDGKGNIKTLAQLVADAVYLDGKIYLLNSMRVENGSIYVDDGAVTGKSIYANGTGTQGIISGRRVACSEFAINGKDYAEETITSTSGYTYNVLGHV